MSLIDWVVLLGFLAGVGIAIDLLLGQRKLVRATTLPTWSGARAPLVSIIVPARNEERKIESGLLSMLGQRWPALEVIAVDDRSTDETGRRIEAIARDDPRVRVERVTELPHGWLGKNHALHLGASRARGEWLLFADADVVLHPDLLGRAMRFAADRGLDHVALAPEFRLPGRVLEAFAAGFIISFHVFLRPWKARDPASSAFVGIGAFNLVRREAYLRAHGHEAIRLRPDDDVKLGKILKRSGARQDMLIGTGLASVEWYASVGELVRGLEKNAFAGLDYRVWLAVFGSAFHLLLWIGPLVGVVVLRGWPQLLCAVLVAGTAALYAFVSREVGLRARTALLYPLFALLFNGIILRTMVVNLAQGGIRWRGTFYPLKELRANRV
ncbi:MAG: glycosyltransferase [Gemmatimonadales bacterium]